MVSTCISANQKAKVSSLPKIAVLLAAYNGEKYLEAQLDTILAQQGVDIEVFASLDISDDSSWAILNNYATQDSRVQLLSYGKKYGSAAQNFFRIIKEVSLQNFNFVALSDQDDIWLPGKLCEAVKTLTEGDFDAYSGNATAFWEDGRRKLINKAQPLKEWDYLFEAAGPGCSYVIKQQLAIDLQKKLLLKSSQLEKVALHDWFIYAFSRSRNYRWVIDSRSFIEYRQHGLNVVGANVGLSSIFRRIKLLRSGWYKEQIKLLVHILEIKSPIAFYFVKGQRFKCLKEIKNMRRNPKDQAALAIMVILKIY